MPRQIQPLDECLKIGRARLHPSIFNPNYLVLRGRAEIFSAWLKVKSGAGWQVLDIGGRYQPYRPLLDGREQNYFAIDLVQTPLVNVVAESQMLPFDSQVFDLVISTQTFEYFEQPQVAAAEVLRVMKFGACFLMSVASFAPQFAPEERWRYLPAGLKTLLKAFSSVELIPETGSIGTFFRILNLYLTSIAPGWVRQTLTYTVVPVFNLLGWHLDRVIRSLAPQFVANYSVLAIK